MTVMIFPGQGTQTKGMGQELFPLYPELAAKASRLLGYDIEQLCLHDEQGLLTRTDYAQPAIFFVNALHWLHAQEHEKIPSPRFLAGHSLGEYNALFAAGAFDLETGLKLVRRRGQLMAQARDGTMLAVLGMPLGALRELLHQEQLHGIDIANHNTRLQIVISGPPPQIEAAHAALTQRAITAVALNVSGAFHSRYMQAAKDEFAAFLKGFHFAPLRLPVLANASADFYRQDDIAATLAEQIVQPVRWYDSICRLHRLDTQLTYRQIGNGPLAKMITQIVKELPAAAPAAAITANIAAAAPPAVLFTIAYAGGDARAYAGLAEHLQGWQEVALERPGRGMRWSEPLLDDMEAMADDLFAQMLARSDGLRRPYAIYGHSLGARLAHLLCRRLQQRGLPLPLHLFVSGSGAPSCVSGEADTVELDASAFWRHLIAMGGCPPEIMQHPDLIKLYEPILRADFAALKPVEAGGARAAPRPAALPVPLTVLTGSEEMLSAHEVAAWQQETTQPMTAQVLHGGHFFIRQHWPTLAALINAVGRDSLLQLNLTTPNMQRNAA